MNTTDNNPYIGPRTFLKEEGHLFFGRDREARDLAALVISERSVLFYAQSGAGKSSLVNTRLIPDLENIGYEVLPVSRVSGELPSGLDVDNIYTYNLMRSLIKREIDPNLIGELSLSDFLRRLNADEQGYFLDSTPFMDEQGNERYTPWRHALIIDQFEEIFNTHQDAWEKRGDFFRQLASAMQNDPYLWVVLVMREDSIAALDPYAYILPGGLRTRYYMQRLNHEAALEAMIKPVEKLRPFAPGVAEKLIEDLSKVKVQKQDKTLAFQPGQFVEPVQLQVVCYSLWGKLPPKGEQITENDLLKLGDVNDALGNYYADRIAATAKDKNVKERFIREWIEKHLIAPGGIRNVVLLESNKTSDGINYEVIQALQSDLVRAERRSGAMFYELTHDRLIEPILENNKRWFAKNSSLLQQQAAVWNQENRREGLLFTGKELTEAADWASQNPDEVNNIEHDFLTACKILRRRRRLRFITITSVLLLLSILTSYAWVQRTQAITAKENAITQEKIAVAAKENAAVQEQIARAGNLAGQAVSLRERNFSASLLLGIESYKLFDNTQSRSVLMDNAQASPRLLRYLALHHNDVYSVAFSPDGMILASASRDKTIILWEIKNHQTINPPLTGHSGSVVSIAFSPNGQIIASSSTDQTIILWDVESHQPIGQPLIGHDGAVYSVAFSPDGKLLASGGADNKIILWNVESHQPITPPLEGHDGIITTIAFHPNGKILASGSTDNKIILWDIENQRQIDQLIRHSDAITSLAFSPERNILASGSADNKVMLWYGINLEGQPIDPPAQLVGHEGYISSIAFSSSGTTLASGSVDRTIIIWSTDTQSQISDALRGHSGWVRSVTFSPDGQTLASGGSDNMVILWDVAGGSDNRGRLGDLKGRSPLGQLFEGHEDSVYSVAFSPNGQIIASSSTDQTIILWDVESHQPIGQPLIGHDGAVYSVAFSPDGKLLASGGADNKIFVWDVESHQPIGQPLSGHDGAVNSVAFSSDGKILVSGGADNKIIVWDVESHKQIKSPLTYQSGFIYSIAFSPDGKILASGSYQNSIQLWDFENVENPSPFGEPFKDNTLTISSLAFSPDGKSLVSGSADNFVILWDLDPQSWIARTCQRVGQNFSRDEWARYFPHEDYNATCPQWLQESEAIPTPTP